MIEPRHIAEVAQDGYSVIEHLVCRNEIELFEKAIADIADTFIDREPAPSTSSEPFATLLAASEADRDLLFTMLERHFILHKISARLCDDLQASGFFDRAGMKVPLVWPDLRIDLPFHSRDLLPVHQDYASSRCSNAFRLWIPLRDANELAGTMCLYPGTHRHGPVAHNLNDPARPHIDPSHYDEARRIVFDLPAGNGVLIDPLVFHASVPNRSDRVKFTLMIQIQDLATLILANDTKYADFAQARTVRQTAREMDRESQGK